MKVEKERRLLQPPVFGDRIEVYRTITSTQDRVKRIFRNSPVESLVVAASQSSGIGRRGGKWESPYGGLYFSVLMKHSGPKDLFSINALICALKSFEKMNLNINWKWPNDLIYEGNKLGGILAEVLSSQWVAVGIGINAGLKKNNFSGDLKDKVSVINMDKKEFIQNFLVFLKKQINNEKLNKEELYFLNSRLVLKGKRIRVGEIEGKVLNIGEEGALKILDNGKIRRVISGAVIEIINKNYPEIALIVVDIGNTRTRVGKVKGDGKIETFVIPTNPHNDFTHRLLERIKKVFEQDLKLIEGVALSSVVTSQTRKTFERLKSEISDNIVNVTSSTRTDLKLKVKNPSQVGADRICNAVAVHNIYGGNVIVVDIGTANTFDVVSDTGDYLGGVIAPGIDSMKEALLNRADKLREYEFRLPKKAIGDETSVSLDIGMYHTLKGQIESTLSAIKKEWMSDFKVVFTGGGVGKLGREFIGNFIVDKDITLKGLAIIFSLEMT